MKTNMSMKTNTSKINIKYNSSYNLVTMSLQRYSANSWQLVEFVYEDPKMHKATLTEA